MRYLAAAMVISLTFSATASAKVNVVATMPDLAAITSAVGGEHVHLSVLALPSQDPHFVDARPHLVLALHRADLLLMIGLDLEVGWLPTLLTGSRNSKLQVGNENVLDCSTVVKLKQIPQMRVDRTMGDLHPGGNPHYLTDPNNAIRVGQAVAGRLGRLDPEHKAVYLSRAEQFASRVKQALARWQQRMRPYHGTEIVGFHRSWVYLAEQFGLRIVAEVEPKPGIAPNAAHVVRVIKLMRSTNVPLILQEAYYPDKASALIAERTGATLIKVSGGTRVSDGQSYLERMEQLVNQVVSTLEKHKK